MASTKLLTSYLLFCVLSLSFIYEAAGHFDRSWQPKDSKDRRHLRGPPFPCFRRPNCAPPIVPLALDHPNVFELGGRSDAAYQIDVGQNKTALHVSFEADHEDVKAYIVLLKAFPSRQDGIVMTTSDERATSWQIVLPAETIKDHNDETIIVKIDNRHHRKASVTLTLSFEPIGTPVLLIALSVTGGILVLVVTAIGIACYLRKKRRRLIQVGFPSLQSSQSQINTIHALNSFHAPNSFQQIDAQQRRLIQQQLVLQQELLLLQQQHLQLRESQQFSPSSIRNQQQQDQQNPEREQDQDQKQQNITPEKLDARFPEILYEYLDTPLSQTICSICLEEMKTRTVCRQLDCNHVFHSECIKLWLVNKISKSQSVSCPNCNRDVGDAPPPETAVTKNNELHDSHVILMIPDNDF